MNAPAPGATDTTFEIAAVDAFHVVAADRTYWRDYQVANRAATDRFLLKPGWRTVYGRHVETALVRVTLGDGTAGWGEATEPICPEVVCRLAASLIAPVLGGRRFASPTALWEAAYELQRGRGHQSGYHLLAMAALDVAVWDAVARRAGLPVAAVLVAEPKRTLDVYLSGLRRGSLAERVALLQSIVEAGYAGAKIFVGGDTAATMAEVRGLRAGVKAPFELMVDALWSHETAAAAADLKRELAAYQVRWLECPLVPEDLAAHRLLAASNGVPTALGEHFFTHHQSALWLEAKVLDVFQPDICRTGFSNGLAQAEIARTLGIRVTPHMGSGSPVVQAAALHFAAATAPTDPVEYQEDLATLLPEAFTSAWRIDGGRMHLPAAPGLGVEIDASALERHVAAVERWAR